MGEDDSEKLKMVEKVGKHKYKISKGFVANMNVPAFFYANPPLADLMFNEYRPGACGPYHPHHVSVVDKLF